MAFYILRIILLVILGSFTVAYVHACDVCGCGASGYYFGITPQFNKNFVGLRYRSQQFESFPNSPLFNTQEVFRITEVWARVYATPRVQVMAFAPYMVNTQRGSGWEKQLHGLGDASLLVNYLWLDRKKKNESATAQHTLATGLGVKLPTGRYRFNLHDQQQVANPNFQTGTGTTDLFTNVQYTFRHNAWGVWADLSTRFNATNSTGYRFGNRVGGNLAGFYVFSNILGGSLMPTAGVWGERSANDRDNGWVVSQTGGDLLNGLLGIDYFYKRYAVGVQYQKPLAQNLGEGLLMAHSRAILSFSVVF